MRQHILAVTDLTVFRPSLLASESKQVSVVDGVATIQSPTTTVYYKENQSVAIAILSPTELEEVLALEGIELCGSGDKIKTADDVTWVNKELYYSIYNIEPVAISDEFGERTHTPPELHCVFAG